MHLIGRRREVTLGIWFEITNYHMAMIAFTICMQVSDWKTVPVRGTDILGQTEVRGASRWHSGGETELAEDLGSGLESSGLRNS